MEPSTSILGPDDGMPSLPAPSATPPIPSAPVPTVPSFRQFGDTAQTRKMIFDNVLKAAQQIEPVTNPRHSLSVENARWSGQEDYSIAEQKQAILSRGTLGRQLYGDLVLRDPAGTVLGTRKTQLARVPYMTDRGTFVVGGNEYTMSHQMRLRPGVFTRQKQNGELESHVNVSKGFSHRLYLDPETGVFRIAIGQAKIPLVPLLRAMGVPDSKLREAWGNELTAINTEKADPQAIKKLHDRLFQNGRKDESVSQHDAVAAAFNAMTLDPEVTKRTLNQPFSNVSSDALMAVTQKLLRVSKGEDEPDDRDALAFQKLVGPEDVFAERLQKAKAITRQMLWKASAKGHLNGTGTNPYDEAIRAGLLGSGLGQPLSEINPADIFDQQARVTRMGEGGITSMDAVPDEARSVQPSQFGFIDFLRTPECYDYETEVMTRQGWKYWPDVVATDELACQVDGRLEYHVPHRLHCYPYVGELCGVDTGRIRYLVTPNHRVWVRSFHKTATYHFEDADRVKNFRKVQSGGFLPYVGDTESVFRLPRVAVSHSPKQVAKSTTLNIVDTIDIDDWAEFMGWWLGEGSSCYHESNGDGHVLYRARISQSLTANPENYAQIELLLARLPFKTYKDKDNCGFTIPGKQLTAYLRQFGGSHERRIPEALLRSRVSARRRLFESLLLAEGRRDRRGVRTQFCTTSSQLATDFQRLAFSLGYSTQYTWEPDDREQSNHGGAHIIHVHKLNEHQVFTKRSPSQGGYGDHYRQAYNDNVYCATVPGGLLYVRRQNGIGHWSGNSGKVGVDARLARAAVKGNDGQIYTQVRLPDGTNAYKTPQEVADSTMAFPNELKRNEPYVAALQKGKVRMVPRETVDFEVPDMENTFSPLGNLIPGKSMVKGQRAVMAARMITQALPLVGAEAPLVQSGVPGEDGVSFEEKYAKHMGAIHADEPSRVVSVDKTGITLANAAGKTKTVQLYDNFPFNQKTFVHQTPVVQPGQIVQPGELLAHSNFTNAKGVTALGLNARVAYVPWGGLNFEDANLVSESFAKRMTSEHMYQHQHEWEDTDHTGRDAFVSIFPATYSKKILANFDDNGVIKPGTTVKHGDPLILIAKEKERNKKSMIRGNKPSYQDASQTWDHEDEGVVTDVVHTNKGAAVVVKAKVRMQVGDKLSGRYGDKGIISHIIPDDQMPVGADGKPFEVLLNPLGVISRCYDEQTEFLTDRGWVYGRDIASVDKFACYHVWTEGLFMMDQLHEFHVADYTGPMLLFQNKMMDFCVTPNHRMWAACGYPGAPWQEVTAERIAGRKGWKVPVAGLPVPGTDVDFALPQIDRHVKDTQSDTSDITINAGDWAEFLGWYVAEGNVDEKVHISQSITANPENCARIEALLSRLPFAWFYNAQNTQFHITSKRLCEYLRPLGLCADKYIPEWLFTQSVAARNRFLDGYLRGDGSKDCTSRTHEYWGAGTMSERLASDLQRLFVYQGRSANMSQHASGMWRVGIHAMRHRILEKQNWETINYDGKIYCPTVPTGYIVTRRNGKILIAGNTNPAQIIEAALGKIAAVRGEPFKIPDFQDEDDMIEFAMKELQKAGMSDTEHITDPTNDRKIPGVFTGNRWFMKLHHTSESKAQGRGLGAYTAEGTPAKGGPEGAKRVGMLETNALLSHGATEIIRGGSMVRGQSNPQYWAQYMSGFKPPTPSIPHVYHKFVNSLRSAGINVIREGSRTHIMALTDKDIDTMAGARELRNVDTVDWKTMAPLKGGLFDPELTGGHASTEGGGNRWSYIKLHEPMPSPVMEEPIRRVLGLTTNKFEDIIAGKERLGGKTGPGAIAAALSTLNVDNEIARAREEIASNKRTARDAAIRRLGYLKSAKRLDIHPKEWILSKAPVLPPAFRPVSTMGANKLPLVADANYLYKELWDANQNLKDLSSQLDETDIGDERLATYNAFKAVTGLGDPTHAKNQERQVKGILKHVFGSSPKLGTVQRRLLGASTDLVGRAVIAPDPDLDMDQVGIPENQAWSIYRPVLIRRLVRRGMPRLQAAKAVEEKSETARKALLDEMDTGVVVINRAPTLHRYGMMAARPRLVKGNVLKISPLVVGGFGADFDGDAMQYHVPVSDEEKNEALEKMLPSRNLLSAATFKIMYAPSQEYIGGLYEATARKNLKDKPLVFHTKADAIRAYQSGRIGVDRQIEILKD